MATSVKKTQLKWVTGPEALGAIESFHQKVPLDKLEFDLHREYGQPRELDATLVTDKLKEMERCPPLAPVENILALRLDPTGKKYIVLGGQHTVKCLQLMKQRLVSEKKHVPEQYEVVYCVVVKPGTSKQICQELAGAHQYRQRGVSEVPFWRWAQAYVEQPGDLDTVTKIMRAVSITGQKRYETEMELLKEYGPVARFLESTKMQGVLLLKALTTSNPNLNTGTLRGPLRQLLTPSSRTAVLSMTGVGDKVSMKTFEDAVREAVHNMWIDFHWSAENPNIEASRLGDEDQKRHFRGMVKTEDLHVSTGAWKWSEASPTPSWATLSKAPVWNLPRMSTVRHALRQRPHSFEVSEGAEDILTLAPIR